MLFRSMLTLVIFDMDGLMIDSEPFWRESEPVVLNKVGVPMTANDAFESRQTGFGAFHPNNPTGSVSGNRIRSQ